MRLSKTILSLILSVFFISNLYASANPSPYLGSRYNPFPKTVEHFDAVKYMGDWYEIASTKPAFSANCVCTKANYKLEEDSVRVTNTCNLKTPDGDLDTAIGTARSYWFNPAIFNVKFELSSRDVSPALAFLLNSLPNYWVIEADEDFQDYAVVTALGKDPIFILSRTPTMSSETYDAIMYRLTKRGFNTDKIVKTVQNLFCEYPMYAQ